MSKELEEIRTSKFLSLVLRHQPETIGIQLDKNGWTDTQILLDKLNQKGFTIDINLLKHLVESNPKKRFVFNDSYNKIRANQGHSVDVELGYTAQKPPPLLYHGTGKQSVASVLETGLEKRTRHHVHLSADIETAIKVGQRHGKPFVFEVLAEEMYKNNFEFFISDNAVWLTDHVPPNYLRKYDQG